ncbi:MAG: precorrin-8X methylmutase [Syntrophorhabdales bacterium]|jgi:precorrin-8X/cobalt-precorrin-8 methylmutase
MERIILIGHGSPKKDANNVDVVASLLHARLHPGCTDPCVRVAYLQFVEPDIGTTIDACVAEGAQRIIVHPFFLYSGMHVTKDIPAKIEEGRKRHPHVEFIYTPPLGIHEGLVRIVLERINSAISPVASEIERRSFEIISEEADFTGVPEERLPIVKRVIHATADFEYASGLIFHPDAVAAGIEAIREGKDIVTDIEMVRSGINKRLLARWGGHVRCGIAADPRDGTPSGRTRAEDGIDRAIREGNTAGIVAIGNAPTALFKVIKIFNEEPPAFLPLVVGVPVGFVKAVESKALLAAQQFPFITNLSRKGGTPVAVAIVNALLTMASAEGA